MTHNDQCDYNVCNDDYGNGNDGCDDDNDNDDGCDNAD